MIRGDTLTLNDGADGSRRCPASQRAILYNFSDAQQTVAIAGGGLAGLAAGCALADAGFRVTLFERRPYLGGRASSYQHPGTGEIVDNCQHVLLGCCTNLIDFYRRTGVEKKIRWYDNLTFLEPGGRASVIGPSALPAPLHTAPSFLRASCLSFSDKARDQPRDDGAGSRYAGGSGERRFSTGCGGMGRPRRRLSASGRRFWSAR